MLRRIKQEGGAPGQTIEQGLSQIGMSGGQWEAWERSWEEVGLALQAVQWELTSWGEEDLGKPKLFPSHSEAQELPPEASGKMADSSIT